MVVLVPVVEELFVGKGPSGEDEEIINIHSACIFGIREFYKQMKDRFPNSIVESIVGGPCNTPFFKILCCEDTPVH
jgi:hypothetical protein